MFGRGDDRAHILICSGRFFRDTSARRAPDKDSLCCEIIDDLPAAPLLKRGVAGERPAGAMAG
jgi:hypothetical protein